MVLEETREDEMIKKETKEKVLKEGASKQDPT